MADTTRRTPALAGLRLLMAILVLCLSSLALPATAQTFPKFTGLVVDDANVLPPQVEADLTAKLAALQKDTKRQLVVATIADLQGYPKEDYGYKLGRAWGVGLRDVDNGAILFIAPNEPAGRRGVRIEVGRGLEPFLTDALSSVIITTDMLPRLRAGDIPGGMTAGTDALIAQLRASPDEAKARTDAAIATFDKANRRAAPSRNGGGFPVGILVPIMILGFVGLSLFRRGGGGRRFRGTGSAAGGVAEVVLWSIASEVARGAFRGGGGDGWGGGGGGSDGGWGGGGFTGGGGGDFGGGGASGDW